MLAFALALVGQYTLEPRPNRGWLAGLIFYVLAIAWLAWAYLRGEWMPGELPEDERRPDPLTVRSLPLYVGIALAVAAFAAMGGNMFTKFNVLLWLLSIACFLRAFWLDAPRSHAWWQAGIDFIHRTEWRIVITRRILPLLALAALAIFFHTYRLAQVPPEMNSDHAEKLLDVYDVLHGQTHIFFTRNTGREAFQFYLTALVTKVFGTGISFLSLKIGTALASLFTLPYIYLLGKELGNRRVGLLAVAFAAIGYWPNVITRLALRFTLYPLFVAPTLYYLVRGLRTSNRNDFIMAGLMLGIGLHTYTPIRILPLVVVAAVGIYLLHRQSKGVRTQTISRLVILALVALIVFIPLLRYASQNPEMFAYRALTRLGDWERPLPAPAWQIFMKNLWNAMVMFGWDNGEVWTVSIPHRPALDVISAALLYLGMALIVLRYLRRRHWADLFILVAIPMLMLPSILSLAFPNENPVLSRTGGALVIVFIVIGIALDGLMKGIQGYLHPIRGERTVWIFSLTLLLFAGFQNYDLVFNQYYNEYLQSSWNTSEIGLVVKEFIHSIGSVDSAWVMGYPYWVDTRLVGINSGYPIKDYAMFVEQLDTTLDMPGAKLFIINLQDQVALQALRTMYPYGWLQRYASAQGENKDFYMYLVPPASAAQGGLTQPASQVPQAYPYP